ncbi:MAG TPA: nuclear transport factor 2 family protein [Lacunisphaera sp.]
MKTALGLLIASMVPVALAGTDNKAAVLAADAVRGDALRRGDATTLATVLSDDLRYIHSNGKFERKSDTVSALAEKKIAFERFETSELNATEIAPGVVVLSGRIDQRKLGNGKWSDAKLLFHAVWRNEGGQWRLVSLQTAMLPVANP